MDCCTHRVMISRTEPTWQLCCRHPGGAGTDGLDNWERSQEVFRWHQRKQWGGKHLTPKRLQLLFRGSGERGRRVPNPDGITSQGNGTGQGTAGLGSSSVEREVGLLVSQELSRGELHPQLSQPGGRQHIKRVGIPLAWPFWDCFGNAGSSLGLPGTKLALTDWSRSSRGHQVQVRYKERQNQLGLFILQESRRKIRLLSAAPWRKGWKRQNSCRCRASLGGSMV